MNVNQFRAVCLSNIDIYLLRVNVKYNFVNDLKCSKFFACNFETRPTDTPQNRLIVKLTFKQN